MRCKPNELCWISYTDEHLSANIGCVVRTISIDPYASDYFREPCWQVVGRPKVLANAGNGSIYPVQGEHHFTVNDSCLTPISDPDKQLEVEKEKELVQ